MLGTVYIGDINFAFQNYQNNANMFGSHGVEYRIVSIDHLHCLLFAFVLFIMGLATNFAVTLEGEAKA